MGWLGMWVRLWSQVGMDSRRRRVVHTDVAVWLSGRMSKGHGLSQLRGVGREKNYYYARRRLDIYNGGIRAHENGDQGGEIGSVMRHGFPEWKKDRDGGCSASPRALLQSAQLSISRQIFSLFSSQSLIGIHHLPGLPPRIASRTACLSSCSHVSTMLHFPALESSSPFDRRLPVC